MQAARPEPLVQHPKYEKLRDLNSGASGFVQLARERASGELVAIKFLERGDKVSKYTLREILNHNRLLHPHIVQFKEVFLTRQYLAIVMEYAAGGDMFQYVVQQKGLSEPDARWFFQQLILGLDYCHALDVVNRDIKLENTLLDGSARPLVKICDFGYSKGAKDSVPKTKVGTPGYAAPEVIQNRRAYDGKAADVWSCGVMLYVMLFCEYPFERAEDKRDPRRLQRVLKRISDCDWYFPAHTPLSAAARDLLERILVRDPDRRITLAGIQRHPWFLEDLPPGVVNLTAQCLLLRDHTAGHQSEDEIRAIVAEAKLTAQQAAGAAHGGSLALAPGGEECEDDEDDDEALQHTLSDLVDDEPLGSSSFTDVT